MSDLGRQLKEARLARALTLDDVQEMTKIRKRYLEAIEAGDFKVLPGTFYVKAFIKTYAEAVGVSADELFAEHHKDMPSAEQEPVMEPVLQRRRTKASSEHNSKWLSTTLMWAFAVIIIAVIYLVVMNSNKGDNNQTADPTPVTSSNSTAGGSAPPAASPEPSVQPSANSANASTAPSASAPADSAAPSASADMEGSTPPADGNVVVTENGREGSSALFNVQSPGGAPVQVTITASGTSWVDVRRGDKSGEKLFYDNTNDGDVLTYELGADGLYIKSGNSTQTVISVGGQTVSDGRNTSKIQLRLATGTGQTEPAAGTDTQGSVSSTNP